jgi:hypothetical protein
MKTIQGYSKNIIETIKLRKSWRTYIPIGLNASQKKELTTFIENLPSSPFSHFGSKTKFEILDMNEIDPSQATQLGTYGFIKGARQFLVGSYTNSDYCIENYGYLFELIILKATEMGLGTCWLAGSFNRSGFSSAFNIKSEENVPAVSPVGPITGHRRLFDIMMRFSMKAKSRFPWAKIFFNGDFTTSLTENEAGKFKEILEMVRIGPSAANGQPWRIVKENGSNKFHFFVDDPPEGKKGFTLFRRLDLGIAAAHFDLVCQKTEYNGNWTFDAPNITLPNHINYRFSWKEE